MMIKHRENWQENGTEQDPFRIECIEDLVAFSIMTNGGNTELGLKSDKFSDKYVTLERTLNFESDVSYRDSTTTKYGDLNKDEKVEDIKSELTKKDEGCIGFTPISGFYGTFDGKENIIRNIYMFNNIEGKSIALFSGGESNIKNLNISGTIINKKWHAAGILVTVSDTNVSNCRNYVNVTGYNLCAGILNGSHGRNVTMSNCINYGTITSLGGSWAYSSSGGLVSTSGKGTIENCANYGSIFDPIRCGGIVGISHSSFNIINCINFGKIQIDGNYANRGGGIASQLGRGDANSKIINCYNLGECDGGLISYFRRYWMGCNSIAHYK